MEALIFLILGVILGLFFRFMKISLSRDPSKDLIKSEEAAAQDNEDDWEDESEGYEDESD